MRKIKPRRALRAFGDGILGRLAPFSAERYIRIVRRTTRWRWEGREVLQGVIDAKTPVIYAFWHSRILMMCPLMEESPLPIRVLVSGNRDGEVISRIVQRFKHQTIRGSTRNPKKAREKGGGAAVIEMLAHLGAGGCGALTPDGPRGPRMRAQVGVSVLSAQSGLSVIPLAYSSSRGKMLKTWDRFLLPLPFGRGAYVVGEAIPPPAQDDAAIDTHRRLIESTLTELSRRADAMTSRETPEPADETGL